MSELSIKVNIAGRTYPLTIKREEEEAIRKAVVNINDRIRVFEENYAVKDKQDLLAMAALQSATEATEASAEVELDQYAERLSSLDQKLSDYLSR